MKPVELPPVSSPWMKVAPAAEYVGVDPRTIYRWIAERKLVAYRAGSHLIRIHRDDLDALMVQVSA